MSWNRERLSFLILLVVVFFGACATENETAQTESLLNESLITTDEVSYYTVPVERGNYQTEVTGALSVVYMQEKDLYLDKANAVYKEVFVKTGQYVEKGDILMTFDIEGSDVELKTLKLKLQRKQEDTQKIAAEKLAVINNKKDHLKEMKDEKLLAANLEIEKLQTAYEQFLYESELEMNDMRQHIADLEEDRKDNMLVAPFSGVIDSVVAISIGDNVIPGTKLISMHSADNFLLETKSTNHALRYNMPVTIEVSSKTTNQSFSGRVVSTPNILPQSVNQDRMFIELDGEVTAEQLIGTIKFRAVLEEVQDVLIINANAVHSENKKYYVNLLEDGVLKKRYVTIYSNKSSDDVWIIDGLSEGQMVVMD